MDWFYAQGGAQMGPVSDAALADLVRTGVIRAETLVWNVGLSGWLPYGQVAAPAPAPAPAEAPVGVGGATFCTECGRPFSPADLVRFGDRVVCGNCKEAFAQRLRQGVAPLSAMVYAGFWVRVGAAFIDGIILAVVWGILFGVAFGVLVPSLRGAASAPDVALATISIVFGLIYLVAIASAACYEAFFVSRSGATPGKKALSLKVVMPDGGPVTLGRAFGRYFAKMLSAIPLYFGFIMVGFDSEKRGLHDYVCNTRVIRT